jgi:tetratricopeptide (TPR) repeat protein
MPAMNAAQTHGLLVGGSRADRLRAADARERTFPGRPRVVLNAATLPFTRFDPTILRGAGSAPPDSPRVVRIDNVELAFPDRQTGGVRLVLTQSTYLLQKLLDLLHPDDVVIATGGLDALQHSAPEAFQGRGPWRRFTAAVAPDAEAVQDTRGRTPSGSSHAAVQALLVSAYASNSPGERHTLCRRAAAEHPGSEVAALSLASACREIQALDCARSALDEALRLAPEWEAAHFEDGKFWLAADDMPQARDAFGRAAALMSGFSAAFSNLGATLGELDDPEGAAAAFARALEGDPDNPTLLNNIGVVERERGRLEASEEALARVVALAPEFVFGHYNLGHTRFLRGDYPGALAAYEEGRRRDPQKNRRQGCRLALVRFANGDAQTAEQELWQLVDSGPAEEREDLLLEACEIALALVEAHPRLAANRRFVDRIRAALTL